MNTLLIQSSHARTLASLMQLKWAILLLLLSLTTVKHLQGQVVLTEGFEASCSSPGNGFYTGCFPGWISTSGGPYATSSFGGTMAHEGDKFARCRVTFSFIHLDDNPASAVRGDGIALNYNFVQGVRYRLRFAYKTSGTVSNRSILLTSGLVNMTGDYNDSDDPGTLIPPIPPTAQPIFSPPAGNSWAVHQVDFTANLNHSQLWFRAANILNNNGVNQGNFFVDAVQLEILCDPNSGVAAFNFEDAQGNPKTEFCFGEDVYLDGTASQNENSYYIDAWRRPLGSTGAFDFVSGLGWTPGQQVGVINLMDAFAGVNYFFDPGYEYRIKLAITNGDCIPWTEVTHEFTLTCCDKEQPSADFSLNLLDAGFSNSIFVYGYEGYQNLNATHEWIVLSSPNRNGGPYTQEYTTTTTGSDGFLLFNLVQPGLYYTVIHKVHTLCGEVCFGEQRFMDDGGRPSPMPDDEKELSCEFCGAFDCSLYSNRCAAPSNIRANLGIQISWDPVPGATGYLVRILNNDPDCCGNDIEPTLLTYATFQTMIRLDYNNGEFDCFSYQVATVCADGSITWSGKECFQYHRPGPGDQDQTGTAPTAPQGKVFPNPARDQVTVNFDAPFSGQASLVDALGRVMGTQEAEEAVSLDFDLSALPSGLYWIVVRNGDEVTTFKVTKQ